MDVEHFTDYRSNEADQIVYAARKIGRSQHKRAVFRAVYFGKQKIKTVGEISSKIDLSRKRVLEEAKKLVTAKIIHQTRYKNDTAYIKDDAYKGVWKKVLGLAGNTEKIKKIPTKTNPLEGRGRVVNLRIPKSKVKIKQVTIDDISSFSKVRRIKNINTSLAKISELKFKTGLLKILQEKKSQKDWGGEKNDVYSSKLRIKGVRFHSAFALKGPGKKVKKLTPKDMGKNGDQIQRLTASSAQVFFVQYWSEIDQSVVDLMQQLAIAKSFSEGRIIMFGVIDGEDSARLIKAYPNAFK